ncbi:MAG: mechanosensitive ion channel protein MscS [Desulfuromonas sp.]|nr:MAG: mechanosensitive ion channel protein MscS [Desulfuromonas sp.]
MELSSEQMALLSQWGMRTLYALGILLIGGYVGRLLTAGIIRLVTKKVQDDLLINFLRTLVGILFWIVVIIAALEQVGFDTTSLVAMLGAMGLAIGLALQGSLQNFAAGIMLIVFRPFKAGDYVEAGGIGGVVERLGLFNTVFRTPDNREVTVPNNAIVGDTITNYAARPTRRIDLVIGIGYGDDIALARQVLKQVLAEEGRILPEPATVIAVSELGESSVNFVVRPWVNSADYWDVRFSLTEKVKIAFDAAGVSIPFPQRDLHIYQEKS